MNEIDRDLIDDIIKDLERFWLYDKDAEQTICPLKNYVGWENLKEIVRKG